jgi:hypothetical protein
MQYLIKNKKLVSACLFFLTVKLLWVIIPTGIMGTPRLGDDALVYMWIGNNTVLSSKLDAPAIKNILEIRRNDDVLTDELEFQRARVTMRTTGVNASPFVFISGGMQKFGLNHKFVFAILEAIIACILTFAIAYSLSRIVGEDAAGFVLFVGAFLIFPNQGLHFLIPGVFVLSLALLQFSLILRDDGVKRLPLILITLPMLLAHPIGQVYTLLSFSISIIKSLIVGRSYRGMLYVPIYLFVSALLWVIITKISGEVAPATSGMGGVSFANFMINFNGIVRIFLKFASNQPIFALCISLGLFNVWLLRRKQVNLFVITFGLLSLIFVSLLVDLPGYPAELATRIFVPFALFAMASFALGVVSYLNHYVLNFFVLIMIFMAIPNFYNLGMSNMNDRAEIYDSRKLNEEISNIPNDSPIIWMDTDNALMAGLIEGAYKHPAIPFNMLAKSQDVFNFVDRRQPVFLATMAPRNLNGIAAKNIYSFKKRFHGYGYSEFSRITLNIAHNINNKLFVRLQLNSISEIVVHGLNGENCSIEKLTGFKDWYIVNGCENLKDISFSGNSNNATFIGASLEYPDNKKSWPWGSDVKITAFPINKTDPIEVIFSYDYLFNSRLFPALKSEFDGISYISDYSGIIWTKAFAKPHIKN